MTRKLVVPVTFEIRQGNVATRTETIAQDVIKIGRDQKSHLRIDADGVSRMHAVIEAKPDAAVQIIDLGSGTFVNGLSVNKCALRSRDEVRVGDARLIVNIGTALDEADWQRTKALTPAPVSAQFVPPVADVSVRASSSLESPTRALATGVDGEEIYQLIKHGDVDPTEVEDVGRQAVEVTILWKNAILHVAHLDGPGDFVLASEKPRVAPTAYAFGGGLVAGASLIAASIATQSYVVGGIGVLAMLAGSGTGIALDHGNVDKNRDTSSFIVGPEILQDARELPVVLHRDGVTRMVFPRGASGDIEIDGVKRTLDELVAAGVLRPSSVAHRAMETEVRANGRYKMEVGGLTVLVRVVAPGRRAAGISQRDSAMLGAGIFSGVGITALILAMRLAIADDNGFLSQGSDEDRLNELRAFISRQQERQPEQQPQNANTQQEGGTGARHAGPEGKMGQRDSAAHNARYAIRRTNEPPHLSRQAAREAVQSRGIFASLGSPGGGAAGGASGIVSPFGALTEAGLDEQNANGNMTGDVIGPASGYEGLGVAGTGWGGGGTAEGVVGLGTLGTMGHGSGTGPGPGYGDGAGRTLHGRPPGGPLVRPAPPSIAGLLSPEAIRRVVLRNLGQVTHCHEQGLAQNSNLEGRVVVRFIIGGQGTVLGANVAESSLAVPSVATCIANSVRRWQFPSPEGGGIVTVNYPFNLQHPE